MCKVLILQLAFCGGLWLPSLFVSYMVRKTRRQILLWCCSYISSFSMHRKFMSPHMTFLCKCSLTEFIKSLILLWTGRWIPCLAWHGKLCPLYMHKLRHEKNCVPHAGWSASLIFQRIDIKFSLVSIYMYKDLSYQLNLWLPTLMTLSFRTDRSGQTVQTQIRLLLEEQSDKGLHCLLFLLHHFDKLP